MEGAFSENNLLGCLSRDYVVRTASSSVSDQDSDSKSESTSESMKTDHEVMVEERPKRRDEFPKHRVSKPIF